MVSQYPGLRRKPAVSQTVNAVNKARQTLRSVPSRAIPLRANDFYSRTVAVARIIPYAGLAINALLMGNAALDYFIAQEERKQDEIGDWYRRQRASDPFNNPPAPIPGGSVPGVPAVWVIPPAWAPFSNPRPEPWYAVSGYRVLQDPAAYWVRNGGTPTGERSALELDGVLPTSQWLTTTPISSAVAADPGAGVWYFDQVNTADIDPPTGFFIPDGYTHWHNQIIYRSTNFTDASNPDNDPYIRPATRPVYPGLDFLIDVAGEKPVTYIPTFYPPAIPIGRAIGLPLPMPWHIIPHVPNTPWRDVGNNPPGVMPEPYVPVVPPSGLPYVSPPVDVIFGSPPAVPLKSSTFHEVRPPGKGEKERKVRVMGRIPFAGAITESLDFLNVLYYSLPKEYLPRYRGTRYILRHPTPLQKAEAVYTHLDKVDLQAFARGLTNEIAIDKVIGLAGRSAKELAQYSGSPVTVLFGGAL